VKVTAIPGEVFRYHVQSKSNPNQTHMVDLIEGQCSCVSWTCRQKKYREIYGKPFECCHLKAAWEQVKDGIRQRYKSK